MPLSYRHVAWLTAVFAGHWEIVLEQPQSLHLTRGYLPKEAIIGHIDGDGEDTKKPPRFLRLRRHSPSTINARD